jgi:bis(5'-nucleosyl)-tetraphosphatase (symmetrical)
MATYAIGDIQGGFEALERLLEQIRFDSAADHLWFVGDLVNRGPQSRATLRFIKDLGERAATVLGNHDLHLLAVAAGCGRLRRNDTLADVLEAEDRDELIEWLRQRPLMHVGNGWAMVHAGLLPQWSIEAALGLAGEVEAALRAPHWREFLATMYGNQPARWSDGLAGADRLRMIVNAMTRLRVCTPDGTMEFEHKAGRDTIPAGYVPWFDVPQRKSAGTPIVCGHWSALGLVMRPDLAALDTGCLWGGRLSALRLEDRTLFQCRCAGMAGTTHWQ